MDNYVTPEEAAEQLGFSGDWIRKLCRAGRIPGARQYGRSWLIPAGAKIEPTGLGRPLRTLEIPRSQHSGTGPKAGKGKKGGVRK